MSGQQIQLAPVTAENWKACIALEVAPDQKDFLPTNLYSIAEAQFYAEARSTAIYNEVDHLVGYALYGRDLATGKWKIFRIMIDRSHQGKGHGEQAMRAIITTIADEPDGDEILISYKMYNLVARALYAKLGFVEQRVDEQGQVTAILKQSCAEIS
ncbi:MAG: GNAT family N-acetyltransferase [Caldilineaceae bacterium]|nr:GNAT family N-acetyltransferase [Caldilineaceae bacterium]MCB0123057.1 GNAT family N-acetyltransferase [Caldilineaceae bacterium]MCB0182907.1 GNAT family N-acetyltransferase [Caldilineaceae bacterium]